MASSNRHWPSMFKSNTSNSHHHQRQHDINPSVMSSGNCNRTTYTSVPGGCEERSPEPKPRWNPKPEQIRILEAIFNSGMVNPPRDEIKKIRAKLQEYGQVGDANVFYWFQNRKSRSKNKQRHLQTTKSQPQPTPPITSDMSAPSSSSSSSDKSSPKTAHKAAALIGSPNVVEVTNSRNQSYRQTHGEVLPEPFFSPVQHAAGGSASTGVFTQEFCFSELSSVVQVADQTVGSCSGFLLSELMMSHGHTAKKVEDERMKLQEQLTYTVTTAPPTTLTVPSTINHIQGAGVGESGTAGPFNPAKSMVFINDMAFEVSVGPLNVREAFGDDAVLLHSSGQPVLTNQWGVTLHSLQHGAFYYLLRTLPPSPRDENTNDLI